MNTRWKCTGRDSDLFVPILSSFSTYHRDCNKSNTMGVASGAGCDYLSGAPEFTSEL